LKKGSDYKNPSPNFSTYTLDRIVSFFDSTGYNNNAFENLIENLYFVDQISNNLLFQKKSAFLKEYEPLLDYTSKTKAS